MLVFPSMLPTRDASDGINSNERSPNETVVMAAEARQGFALEHASDDLEGNETFGIAAVPLSVNLAYRVG